MHSLRNTIFKECFLYGRSLSNKGNEINPVVGELISCLKSGQRAALAEAITLVESTNAHRKILSKQLLSAVLESSSNEWGGFGETFRMGISGPPGAGKSTFIERFGRHLTSKGLKVAVLAIDPSSAVTGGSILGDKTRMPYLSKDENAYIRASPSCGHLGGATRSTNEAIALCEAAGYHVVIIETVGVGQSEFAVADMVDMFALIIPPGAGDQLQGIKRGIMEMSDIIIINKSDGDLIDAAIRIQYEYLSAIKFVRPRCKEWKIPVKRVSSMNGDGISELWQTIVDFTKKMKINGQFMNRRKKQRKTWLWNHLMHNIVTNLHADIKLKKEIRYFESEVMKGNIAPGLAADLILESFIETLSKSK